MCDRCGLPDSHGAALSERSAHRLAGRFWEGSHAEAAAGAIRPLIEEMKSVSAGRSGLWRSPIVGLTWNARSGSDRTGNSPAGSDDVGNDKAGNDRPAGFRYFVGIAVDDGEEPLSGLDVLDLPEMTFASSWHGPEDGGVVQHYLGMIDWIADMGMKRDLAHFDQREEYPPDVDIAGPPALRLMLPVMRD